MSQSNLNLSTKAGGPVECLRQTFASENERREHFLKLLAEKLKDPEFRKIEGFPIGKDEDILALSDPPYYTACPNPWLGEFIKCYGTPFDPKQPYHREPFAADVGEGKYHPAYKLHPYPTKVPHRAIMRYILHYTQPGEVVFDGFAGTGMTGVAARSCGDRAEVESLGYKVGKDGKILNENGEPFALLGARSVVLGDLSPGASFIAHAANTSIEGRGFEKRAKDALLSVERDHGWMFKTLHSAKPKDAAQFSKELSQTKDEAHFRELILTLSGQCALGRINYAVWSDVFTCPECGGEIIYWVTCVDRAHGKVRDSFPCPHCSASLTKRDMNRVNETMFDSSRQKTVTLARQVMVHINYSVGSSRFEKNPDTFDKVMIEAVVRLPIEDWHPATPLPKGDKTSEPIRLGVTHAHQFYSRRNLACFAAFRAKCVEDPALLFVVTKLAFQITKLYRFTYMSGVWGAGGGPLSGTLYIPSLNKELNVLKQMSRAIDDRLSVTEIPGAPRALISTGSCSRTNATDESVDYLFFDPPFGANLMYSELNFLTESWLKVLTDKHKEAVQSDSQSKTLHDYRELMIECFREAFRILKPGRWMTVEFSNTQASVWNSIQTALQEAGFIVANVSMLDKLKGTFNSVNNPTSVKQDLVISAYKPNGGLEERFAKRGETEEGAWDFTRTHLTNLPVAKAKGGQMEVIAERDPRILYDRMVAFYVGHTTPVPLSSAEFQAGLADKFPERDGMYFLPEQVNEYDKKRAQVENIGQLTIFVEDERSAINWLRSFLKDRPSVYSDIQPEFMQQLGASWKKWEARPELHALLDQNFLCHEGTGEVPSQIHSYLSTQFKELRNLAKDHAQLKTKAKNRWYVPDPKKNVDVETLRNKRLLEEFWSYLPEGYTPPALTANKGQTLPGLTVPRPKTPKGKKLKELRTEAIRVGFKHCYQQKDYTTILVVADMIPESVLNEDEQLQMIYDTAVTRSGGQPS